MNVIVIHHFLLSDRELYVFCVTWFCSVQEQAAVEEQLSLHQQRAALQVRIKIRCASRISAAVNHLIFY